MFNRCNVVESKYKKDAAVFKVPQKNPDSKEKWLKFLNRKDPPQENYIFICEPHFEEKYLKKENDHRTRLRMSLNPIPTMYPESLVKDMPSFFPNLTPLRKAPKKKNSDLMKLIALLIRI